MSSLDARKRIAAKSFAAPRRGDNVALFSVASAWNCVKIALQTFS